MVRTQVHLDEKQLQALKQRSAETGRSIADLVREGVNARAASGKFASGSRGTSARHDHYLAEAFRE